MMYMYINYRVPVRIGVYSTWTYLYTYMCVHMHIHMGFIENLTNNFAECCLELSFCIEFQFFSCWLLEAVWGHGLAGLSAWGYL